MGTAGGQQGGWGAYLVVWVSRLRELALTCWAGPTAVGWGPHPQDSQSQAWDLGGGRGAALCSGSAGAGRPASADLTWGSSEGLRGEGRRREVRAPWAQPHGQWPWKLAQWAVGGRSPRSRHLGSWGAGRPRSLVYTVPGGGRVRRGSTVEARPCGGPRVRAASGTRLQDRAGPHSGCRFSRPHRKGVG